MNISPTSTAYLHAERHPVDTPSIAGTVIGVKDITNIRACTSCGKITTPYQSSRTLGQCQGCSLIQILASCDIQWSLLLLIKASDGSKRVISVYNQQLPQLLNVLEIELKLNLVSAEQLTVALLQNTTIFCIFHNASSNKMLDVQMNILVTVLHITYMLGDSEAIIIYCLFFPLLYSISC